VTAPLSAVGHEQRPNLTRLMARAREALNSRIVLGNKENRLVQIPFDCRRRDERGVFKPIFTGSAPHLGDARQVEPRGLAQAGEHGDQLMPALPARSQACETSPRVVHNTKSGILLPPKISDEGESNHA
jgi:hypothetical protein